MNILAVCLIDLVSVAKKSTSTVHAKLESAAESSYLARAVIPEMPSLIEMSKFQI